MDSLTQLTLGAAVGEAVLGRKVGNRAILWGAIAGTLPDLDVFIPLGDVVSDFTYHRSASHSLFVLAALTPVMVWLINKVHPSLREHRLHWAMMIYLCFVTHVLLDSLTAYGTQIFWPFVTTPVAFSTIFIIDPSYTLPLLIGVIAALVMTRDNDRGHLVNRYGLAISTAYLCWTIVAKGVVGERFEEALADQGIEYRAVFTTPGPFNSLLWRAVVMAEEGYYEGWYSIFDGDADVRFIPHSSDPGLLQGIEDSWAVQRLQWFAHGFYSVSRRGDDVIISDLRMGIEPNYVFRFKVGEIGNPHARATDPEQLVPVRDMSRLAQMWSRIWDASVPFGAGS